MLTKESVLSKQTKVFPGLFQKPALMERACAPRRPQAAKSPTGTLFLITFSLVPSHAREKVVMEFVLFDE